ncbi:putative ripening-related protein 7 [Dichanthelium oligosanthes]|uniref:Putative ripening-related protein 7 n=1 Tax=Dichanthelium oligosanthes TaxID=888268 RepID=A0A1E5UVX6_9POAL|nr:putative ripening-related protein 7 [Dichanthelium oligosanthes]
MANAKIAVAIAILALFQVSSAAARWHGKLGAPDRGKSGSGPSARDGHFHSDKELIVALSTGWFPHGHPCHRTIRIMSKLNGRNVKAWDEYDSSRRCRNNIVDSSPPVWRALGLDTDIDEVSITWSDA